MAEHSKAYIIGFSTAVCLVCAVVVSLSAVTLKERQEVNKTLKRQKMVLSVAGLLEDGKAPDAAQVQALFTQNIKARVVNLKDGTYSETDPASFDQRKARDDAKLGRKAPANLAQIQRIPNEALVYQVVKGEEVTMLVLPIEGKGLWSTMYGYIALDKDVQTIRGITFYEHGETPGLGGEVDNPNWKKLWPDRKAFDESWAVKIEVIKGQARAASEDPYRVDGLSGATITSRGVSHTVAFWLGQDGFGPYLKRFRQGELK
jgi:Na+-transporting NADH:ubiquinone oxidoreductase subunit C